MQKMLNLIGDKVLDGTKKKEYDNLIIQQRKDLIDFFFTIFRQNFYIKDVDVDKNPSRDVTSEIKDIILATIFNQDKILEIKQETHPIKRRMKYRTLEQQCVLDISNANLGYEFNIERREYIRALEQVLDIIKDNKTLQQYFYMKLKETIDRAIVLSSFRMPIITKERDESNE